MAKRSKIKESSGDDASEKRRSDRPHPKGMRGRWRALKAWWRDARRLGLPVVVCATAFLFMLGISAIWFPGAFGPDIGGALTGLGGGASYLFIVGLILFGVAAYYAAGYLLKVREFDRLVDTPSKGDFIRTQDRIERLAFELGKREQDRVAARKKEFRIRH